MSSTQGVNAGPDESNVEDIDDFVEEDKNDDSSEEVWDDTLHDFLVLVYISS